MLESVNQLLSVKIMSEEKGPTFRVGYMAEPQGHGELEFRPVASWR